MTDCIFCKLIAGVFPAQVVFEDDTGFAFMDINPIQAGHVLLVPKNHYATLDEMPADEAGALLSLLPALVGAVKKATGAEGVNVLQNNGAAAHQEVGHVHFHIIPRTTGDDWHWNWPAKECPAEKLAELRTAVADNLVS